MTVFKTFWNIAKKYKGTILMYTMILIIFGGMNMQTQDNQMNFVDSKPDIFIINHDRENKITDNLVKYLEENSNRVTLKNNKDAIKDALFYRDISYIIEIPENYGNDIKENKNPEIIVQSTGSYQAGLAERILSRYIQTQNVYAKYIHDEKELISAIDTSLSKTTKVELTSKIDTDSIEKMTQYFNFASYTIMAVIIFIICLILSSFKEKTVRKRIVVSSMNYRKHNQKILAASLTYAMIVWILFAVLGLALLRDSLLTARGAIYLWNSFVFTFCSLTIAQLISTLVTNKEAVSGIVNVVALGSAFLCGAFVPAEWLPDFVLKIAHFLPSYWYIHSNDLLSKMEIINLGNLEPIFQNTMVLFAFSLFFIILNNRISKQRQINQE